MQKIFEYKITKLLLGTIFFLPLCSIVFSGNSIFSVNDDFAAIALLKIGEPHVFMMSYPLAVLLVFLYKVMPAVPWYSIVNTATLALSSIIYFKTLNLLFKKNFYFYSLFFLIGLIFYSYAIKNISISIVTILSFSTSFLILLWESKSKIFLFSIALFLSFLLRDFYIIFSIFFSIIVFFIIINKIIFKLEYDLIKKGYLFLLLPLIIVLLHNLGYSSPEYKEWIKFNSARAIQSDCYQFIPEENKLVKQENIIIFKLWYPFDQEVLPTETIIKISGSFLQLYKNAFKLINKKYFIKTKIIYHYKYLLFFIFIFFGIFLTFRKYKFKPIFMFLVSNIVLIIPLFLIILIRDVDRLTVGLFFIIFCYNLFFIYDYCCSSKYKKNICSNNYKIILFLVLIFSIGAFWAKDFSCTILNQDIKNNFKTEVREYKEFRKGYEEYNLIPCVLLPYFMCNFFVVQNFFEDDSIGNYTDQKFFPVGWLARSPFYYKKLHEKGFNTFYDFLMDEKTLFFGGKNISTEFNGKYLNYLDANFGNNEYKHSIETVKINDLFSFSKIIRIKK